MPAVVWTPGGELLAFGDDHKITRWDSSGDLQDKVADLEPFATDAHWFPMSGAAVTDAYALACTDGTFRLMNRAGREEKKVPAHHGACIALRWSFDGSALVTAGEDGIVRTWSRSGMLRATIAQNGTNYDAARIH